MLNLKVNPVGIDIPLQAAQKKMHKHLMKDWGLNTEIDSDNSLYECYGRAYRNQTDRGYIAEVYAGGNEYKEVYINDRITALSFFGISTEVSSDVLNRASVHLVFFVDLSKITIKDRLGDLVIHRADEEVRQQVFRSLSKFSFGLNYQGFELGIENVLREYPGSRRDDRLRFRDMHPFHCFRFNYQLFFDPNKIC